MCGLAVSAVWLALAVGPALALVVHPYVCQITGTNPGSASECSSGGSAAPGGLANPYGVTISGGDVWIASPGTPAVDEFDSTGAFVSQIPGSGSGYSFAGLAHSVSRDDATGQLYIADSSPDAVDVFNSTGGFVAKWTGSSTPSGSFGSGYVAAAADNSTGSSSGDVYVLDTTHEVIDRLDSSGSPVSFSGSASYISASQLTGTPSGAFKFNSNSSDALAVDSSGDIWVADVGNKQVDEFSSAGTFIQSITGAGTPTGSFGSITGVAVENASGNVYVVDTGNDVVDEFSGSGAFLSQVSGAVTPAGSFTPQGVAVDSSGNVYVTDGQHNVIDRFAATTTVIPDVTAAAASNIQETSATLSGAVNPDGVAVSSCQFEYGTSSSALAQTATCSPAAASIGSGTSAVSVSADLTGLKDDTTYFFRLAAGNASGVNTSTVQSFTTLGPPQIQPEAASAVTRTSATLNAQVNPFGTDSSCEFEYGTDTSYSSGSVTCTPADLGSGESAVSATASLTGLSPGTTYHYRVVATSSLGTVDGADQTFTTLPAVSILASYTTNLTGTSVDLNAQINPQGLDTTYHFQWGTTTAYGNTIPVPDADIGSGSTAVTVTQQVTGLTANTLYHWRVVATNSVGTTNGTDQTFIYQPAVPSGLGCPNAQFRTGPAANLPDCRAYEQVSPVDKDGADVGFPAQGVAVDGNSISYYSQGGFAGQQSNSGLQNWYLSSRDGSGWSTVGIEPPVYNARSLTAEAQYEGWSPDLQHMIVETKVLGGPQDIYLRNPDGSFTLLNPGAPLVTNGGDVTTMYEGASPDFSHILFAPTEGSSITEEWANGAVSPASPTVVPSQCTTGDVGQSGPGGNCATSVSLNPTQFVNVDGYLTSIADFTSREELTNDANSGKGGQGVDLYEYDAQTGTLTDLSADSNPADTNGAQVAGIVAASADGSYVYFAARGVLAPGASAATCNFPASSTCNLYVWHNGKVAFITTLTGTDENDWSSDNTSRITVAQASGDGAHLLFASHSSLTGYDNAGFSEVYLYDAGSGRITCVSCDPSGAAATGNAVFSQSQGSGTLDYAEQTNISTDGSRVFFESTDALVPGDTNAAGGCAPVFGKPSCSDVYEWEADGTGSCDSTAQNGGCLYLISTGQSNAASFFEGANPSGSDVFFATRDQLVGQDQDGNYDVYDARVDGGLAGQTPSAAASCSGTACQGPASGQPQPPTAASVTFTGAGNVSASAPTGNVKLLSKVVRGASFFVRVRVPGKGRVTISGPGVRRVTKSVGRAGTYRLKVTLTAQGKRKLKREHELKLALRIGYAPVGANASEVTVRLTVKPVAARHATSKRGGAR